MSTGLSRIPFSVRLLVTFVFTVTVAGSAAYTLLAWRHSDQLEREGLRSAQVDARTIGKAAEFTNEHEDLLGEIQEILEVIAARADVSAVTLTDERGIVIAAGDEEHVGMRNRSDQTRAALRKNDSFAGRDEHKELRYVVPVDIEGRRYVFEIRQSSRVLEENRDDLRTSLLWIGLGTLAGGSLLFWTVGGRSLTAVHKHALERATRDGLTDLGNHRAFSNELERDVSLASRQGEDVSLALADLDDFKRVNDRGGHAHGDELLRNGARVLDSGRTEDRVFRIGGDEFAVLMPHTRESDACRTMNRLRNELLAVGARMSVGVSAVRPGMHDPATLREEADAALYEAKRRGGDFAVPYSEIRLTVPVVTAEKRAALAQLLADERIPIAFQPIWDLGEGTILGVEALARPRDHLAFASPAEAFDVAEKMGHLHQLDQICARSALADARHLHEGMSLFINLTPQTVDGLAEDAGWLLEAASSAGLDTNRVVVEVTERVGARASGVIRGVAALRSAGFRIALDDVATGNSGLQLMRHINVDFVKIDRSVSVAAQLDEGARAVLYAICAYAYERGAFVIAEGIEDDEMLFSLIGIGSGRDALAIRGGQGYGLGKPTPSIGDLATRRLRQFEAA